MKCFILSAILLGVMAIAAGAIAPTAQAIPDLRGQWTGYNAQGQNIGVNKITQDGKSITFHHPNGQVTSGATINDRRSLYVPVWGSTGMISADGNRIDFKGGSMNGIYFVRAGGASPNTGTQGASVGGKTGSGITLNIKAVFEPKKGVDGASNLEYTCGKMNIPAGPGTLDIDAVETPYYSFRDLGNKVLKGKNWNSPVLFVDAPFFLPDMCRNEKFEHRPTTLVNEAPATFTSRVSCANYGKPFTLTICVPAKGYNTTPNCFGCPPGWAQLRQTVNVKATWTPIKTSASNSSDAPTAAPPQQRNARSQR